jgi:hypothetical protein
MDRLLAIQDKLWVTPEGCWHYTGALTRGGYGMARTLVHRYVWTTLVGDIPDGMQIDHACKQRSCCNPAHLRVVTRRANVLNNSGGVAARNARKVACKAGHLFDEANTYLRPDGYRTCRICRAKAQRKYKRSHP